MTPWLPIYCQAPAVSPPQADQPLLLELVEHLGLGPLPDDVAVGHDHQRRLGVRLHQADRLAGLDDAASGPRPSSAASRRSWRAPPSCAPPCRAPHRRSSSSGFSPTASTFSSSRSSASCRQPLARSSGPPGIGKFGMARIGSGHVRVRPAAACTPCPSAPLDAGERISWRARCPWPFRPRDRRRVEHARGQRNDRLGHVQHEDLHAARRAGRR